MVHGAFQWQGPNQLASYLASVVKYRAIDLYKTRLKVLKAELLGFSDPVVEGLDPSDAVSDAETLERLVQVTERLDPLLRSVLLDLAYGYSVRATASRQGMSKSKIQRLRNEAINAVRNAMRGENE